MPKMSDAAKIAQAHMRYQIGENRERQDKYVKRKLGRIGYELDGENTNRDILTAKRGDNIHINYNGTNVSSPRDLLSDVALATGIQKTNPQFTARRRKTRDIMRQYGDDKDYSLGGYSLGGSVGLDIMGSSKSIRDRVNKVHVFNPGYTKMFHDSIKVDKNVKKELDKKVNIHRTKGDVVSAHANKEVSFGNLFEYKSEDPQADLTDKHSIDNFVNVDM